MSSIFGSLKRTARAGRLKAELFLLDREIKSRQEAFGVQLYDYLEPLSKNPSFFSADDRLTEVLRPPLLESQREIAVVYNKKHNLKERMKQAEVKRAAAFPKKAENWQEKLQNAARSTALAGNEAALQTEMIVLDNTLKAHKQMFGVKLYGTLEGLEDREGWLPTDREVRSIYDACRRDIEQIRKKAKVKMDELESLGISQKEIQDERDSLNAQENNQNGGGLYTNPQPPPPSVMTPVHQPPAAAAAAATTMRDPYVSTPTSELPVARPITTPTFVAPETPVLAFATTAPAPSTAPPPLPGMGPIGGTPVGGVMPPPPPHASMTGIPGTMGGSMSGSFSSNNQPMGGMMGGGFGSYNDNFKDGEEGGFTMGVFAGSAGMGGGGGGFGGSAATNPLVQQPYHHPPQQNNADPWGGGDPFAAFAPAPSSAPPPPYPQNQPSQYHQQQRQPGQPPDSKLFLY